MKISSESKTEYGPCGAHEKYALMILAVMFTSPLWITFTYWLLN